MWALEMLWRSLSVSNPSRWSSFSSLLRCRALLIPTLFQTYFVVQLIQKGSRKQWLDTKRLPKHSTITVILLCFTDPDAVVSCRRQTRRHPSPFHDT